MRKKIVAGNWKMNKNAEETEDLLNDLINKLPNDIEAQIIGRVEAGEGKSVAMKTEFGEWEYRQKINYT